MTTHPIIACVIPAYNEEKFIARVIGEIPDFVSHIIVVNDASCDHTREIVSTLTEPRLHLINHTSNRGVGAAVISGYKKALELNADIIVKVDGDGQMDLSKVDFLLFPLLGGEADYSKGVRFRDADVMKKMPFVRLIGNIGLSFLTKVASGYWNIFDPTNGYTAIKANVLKQIDLNRIKEGYLFETSMLIALYRIDAVVVDTKFKARYGDEKSGLNHLKCLVTFPGFLLKSYLKRIIWRYYILDFSAASLFFLTGNLLFFSGLFFGVYKWIVSYLSMVVTSTGTVMLSVVPLLLGFQILLQFMVLDINNVPRSPLSNVLDDHDRLKILDSPESSE
jgi:dolichol-phosphate mannosyltransferase